MFLRTPTPEATPIQQSDGNAQIDHDDGDDAVAVIRNDIDDLLSHWEKKAENESIDLSRE